MLLISECQVLQLSRHKQGGQTGTNFIFSDNMITFLCSKSTDSVINITIGWFSKTALLDLVTFYVVDCIVLHCGFVPRLVPLSKVLYHSCFIRGQRCICWSCRLKLTLSVISDVKPIIYFSSSRISLVARASDSQSGKSGFEAGLRP